MKSFQILAKQDLVSITNTKKRLIQFFCSTFRFKAGLHYSANCKKIFRAKRKENQIYVI